MTLAPHPALPAAQPSPRGRVVSSRDLVEGRVALSPASVSAIVQCHDFALRHQAELSVTTNA